MMKRYFCSFLILYLLLTSPFQLIAEEIPMTEPVEELIEASIDATDPPGETVGTQDLASNGETIDVLTEEPANETAEPINDAVGTAVLPSADETIEEILEVPDIAPEPPAPHLIINEIMVGSEVNPEKDNWIELYNPTAEAIMLDEWQIKGVTKGGRWIDLVNDPELKVEPDDYFLFSYYSNSRYSALDFKPEMTKSSIAFVNEIIEIELKAPDGQIIDLISIKHTPSDEFRSYERTDPLADGLLEESWTAATLQVNLKENLSKTYGTPHSPNNEIPTEDQNTVTISDETVGTQDLASTDETTETITDNPQNETTYAPIKLINEFMVNPAGKDGLGEWVELYNSTNGPINITGWFLDDADGNSTAYYFRSETILMPGAYLTIKSPELNLSLKNSEDQVRLLAPNKQAIEVINYSGAKEDWTYAKKNDGSFEWTVLITPDKPNEFPAPPKPYRPDDVHFKSILVNPDGKDAGKEKITLKNNLNESIDLTQWKLMNQKSKSYELKGLKMEPFEKLTFNPADIGLGLVNKADQLSLMDPVGNLIDRINWMEAKNDQWIYKPNYFYDGLSAQITKVIDGDTVVVTIEDESFTIRLIGVDTPETVHPNKAIEEFGLEASEYLKQMLINQTVSLSFDETTMDKYNRLLAYIHLENEFINAEIIKKGYGTAYVRFPFKYLDDFVRYEQQAKADGVGIWIHSETETWLENNEFENPEGEDHSPPSNDELNIENTVKLESTVNTENDEKNNEMALIKAIDFQTEGLKIDRILPNSEKGISMEFIKIKNNTNEKIWLNGWQLDDDLEKGSKPFQIKGGAIGPGASRTFRKSETKLSLNNSNDCATLINPLGEIVDQICYTKTHKNEIFTHKGGDWKPKPKKPKARSANRAPKQPSREATAYQWELKNETLNGMVDYIFEKGEVLYLKKDEIILPISFAGNQVDIRMAKELIDLTRPVTLQVRTYGEERQLIGIEQESQKAEIKSKNNFPIEFKYLIGLLILIGGFYSLKLRFHTPQKS